MRYVRELLLMVAITAILFAGIRSTIETSRVYLSSMEPNFLEGQRLLVNKVVYRFHPPQRGDVIIFRPPHIDRGNYIKRVIGLPGEYVEIKCTEVRMRRDLARSGGKTKVPLLRYRATYLNWSMTFDLLYDASLIDEVDVLNLIEANGFRCGIGDWRPSLEGMHGTFHIARPGELA